MGSHAVPPSAALLAQWVPEGRALALPCATRREHGDAGGNRKSPIEWAIAFTCHSSPEKPFYARHTIPTVSLNVIALVASSCGYYRGQIEPQAAQECTVHVVTQRGRPKRLQHRHSPRVQLGVPIREQHCRHP